MRKLYLSVFAVLACLSSFAENITATTTGNWTNAATWRINGQPAGRTPQNGDIIAIQQGITVTLNNGATTTLTNVQLNISGILTMNNNNTLLSLIYSSVTVNSTSSGMIDRQNGNQDLTVNSTTIFPTTTTKTITTGTFGSYFPLPVKFTGFSVARQNSDVLVQWSTAEEVNALSYEVERSTDGNSWNRIATVGAKGNSSSLTNYSYTDKNASTSVAYYRIKQVDIDGKFIYTTTQAVKSAASTVDVKVAAINNRVVLQFSSPVKGDVEVRLVTLSGQVVNKQVLRQPVGQVVLNTSSVKGNYIISVSNAQDINVAKQVVL